MTLISDLPPELLPCIAGHLHAAVDVVRFHAVCREWRDALRYLPRRPSFLPWLLAPWPTPDDDTAAAGGACRCVFSRTTYHAPGLGNRDKRVAHYDGGASWFVGGLFVNPLTGRAAACAVDDPYLSDWIDNEGSRCIFSGDGTLLTCCFYDAGPPLSIYGAIWCPDYQQVWKRLGDADSDERACAVAYHDGAAVCVDLARCYVHEIGGPAAGDQTTFLPLPDEPGKVRRRSYLLELRGELLLTSVLQDAGCTDDDDDDDDRLSVSVHAFDLVAALNALDQLDAAVDGAGGGDPPSPSVWGKMDGATGDHVLFLGYPSSFAVEAARYGGEVPGGSAYFVGRSKPCRVYRCSFKDDGTAATLVDTLPAGWNDERCMWFLPEPDIAPVIGART
jgi:hypothetical protein